MKRKQNGNVQTKPAEPEQVIAVTRDGDWLPLPELLTVAVSASEAEGNLAVSVEGVDYLDAGALQILLALAAEREKNGRGMSLANTSPALEKWFAYAGGGRTSLLNISAQGNA